MALTIGFTSMDQATETALRAVFAEANEQLHGHFTLVPETSAEYVVIDMDSMYGPMGWLRLHAAGKQVVGLTSAPRTQADFRLGRPFDTVMMIGLLREIAARSGLDLTTEPPAGPDQARQPAAPPPVPEATPSATAPPAGPTPQPEPASPASASAPPDMPANAGGTPVETEPTPAPASAVPAAAPPPAPAPAREPIFADWLRPGALGGKRRYQRDAGPVLWIDADQRIYHGPAQLKPLVDYFRGNVPREAFEPVDEATWHAGARVGGEAQPLTRLLWLGGLLAGDGTLLPGHDPDGRYRLTKWPQTEREYPRHFRIATAMMKGPATVAEIAQASGSPAAEVADFVNANLATGYAELVPEPEPEPETPQKSGGLFGRLRRKP